MRARPFADNLRRGLVPVLPLYTPAKAASATFNPDKWCCTRSRSFFNCFTIPDKLANVVSPSGGDCSRGIRRGGTFVFWTVKRGNSSRREYCLVTGCCLSPIGVDEHFPLRPELHRRRTQARNPIERR